MKFKDLQTKNEADLKKTLGELETKLRELRFGLTGARGKNVKETSNMKKSVARIKTLLGAKK